MYEMNGNEEDAIITLEEGEALSNTYSLPIFKILFSSALGIHARTNFSFFHVPFSCN